MSSRKEQLDRDRATLWRAGKLRWKLHSDQKTLYDAYRKWENFSFEERKAGRNPPGLYPRVFLADCGRRYGKDYWGCVIRIEDAIRKPGSNLTIGTAQAKDIAGIIVPLIEKICEDCPLDIKPVYRQAMQGAESGYFFKNGSAIRLIGIERNPDSLRGRASDGITISEAGFVEKLEYALLDVMTPMLMGRLDATVIFNSTPPKTPGEFYDTHITPDCQEHGRYALRTIDDNPLLGQSEKEEFIRTLGGRDSDRCKRELYCVRIRSTDIVVLPEFSVEKHVRSSEMPKHAVAFTVMDPGVRDMCGVIVGYYDFARAKLVVKRSWAKRGANTLEVAEAIRALEEEVFGKDSCNLKYWNGRALANNPMHRFSDTEARMILDLSTLHKLKFAPADKVDAEAALNALRTAIQLDQVEIDPEAKDLISHCTNAVWNQQRTSYARSPVYGHYDLVDCLKYAVRMVLPSKRINPNPPAGHAYYLNGGKSQNILWRPSDWAHPNDIRSKLAKILPSRKKSHTS